MPSVAHSFRKLVRPLGRDLTEFLYPSACVRCGESLPSDEIRVECESAAGNRFCNECRECLRCRIEYSCLTCGAPVGPHLATWGCRHCRTDQFSFERVVALGVYEKDLEVCCRRIKESFEAPLAAGLADLLWDAHQGTFTEAGIDLIVPVPHHWWERTIRRHLPPVTLARILARRLSVRMTTHILAKHRRTPAQSSLPPSRRRKNLRDAFRVAGGAKLDGLTVLLTDDILTTGTTADRAARVLTRAGAARVIVGVIARGIGKSPTSLPTPRSATSDQL